MNGVKAMNKCPNCNVSVYENEKNCPLCHEQFENIKNDSVVKYPNYKNIVKKHSIIKNILLLITFSTILICIYINLFTHEEGNVIWSIIVSISALYAFLIFRTIITSSKRFGAKIVITYILSSCLLITIDLSSGQFLWSTNYVFPFLTLAVIIYLTILAVRSKRLFSEYFGYILSVTSISFILIPLYLVGLSNKAWSAFVVILSCVIIALALYLFTDKSLKQEIKKRFHR